METTDHAQIAYDAFAPIYDDFNAQNDYEFWFSVLLPPPLQPHTATRSLSTNGHFNTSFAAIA